MSSFSTLTRTFVALALLWAFAPGLNAQITLTDSDMAAPGGTQTMLQDTATDVLAPGPGGNQTWDFTMLNTSTALWDTARFFSAGNTPSGSMFPNATMAVRQQLLYTYHEVTPSLLLDHGFAGELNLGGFTLEDEVVFDSAAAAMPFPATYNAAWTDSYRWKVEIDANAVGLGAFADSIRLIRNTQRVDSIDGYGTVQLPYDTIPDALRLMRIEYNTDSIFIKTSFGGWTGDLSLFNIDNPQLDTTFTYQWWAQGYGIPVLQFSTDAEDTVGLFGVQYYSSQQPMTSSLQEATPPAEALLLYPNPANDILRINAAQPLQRLEVIDLQGRVVLHQPLSGNTTQASLQLNHLPKGMYMLRVHYSGGQTAIRRFLHR